jgi:hypothetical protein
MPTTNDEATNEVVGQTQEANDKQTFTQGDKETAIILETEAQDVN